jgi:tRNA(Leu) C34 or U34 (ribose-2'-O)-methylase TrmL
MDAPDLPLRLLSKAEGVLQYRSSLLVVIERCVNDFNYSAILRTAEALGIQDVWLVDPPLPSATSDAPNKDTEEGGADDNDPEDGENVERAYVPGDVNGVDEGRSARGGEAKSIVVGVDRLALAPNELESRKLHHLFAQKATEWLTIREFSSSTECLRGLRDAGYQVWATDLSQDAVPLTVSCMPRSLPPSSRVALVFGTEAVGVSREILEGADMCVYLPLRGFADSLNLSVATALVVHQVFALYPSMVGNYPDKDGLRSTWFAKLASQRTLSQRQKKDRKKLGCAIADCHSYVEKRDRGETLTREQEIKLARLSEYKVRLKKLDDEATSNSDVVEHYVRNPPPPLSDLRRADVHRVTYVGKATKARHQDHWSGMAATANPRTRPMATKVMFRCCPEPKAGSQ